MEHEVDLKESGTSFLDDMDTKQVQTEPATLSDYVQLMKPGIIFSNLLTAFAGIWLASAGFKNFQFDLTIYTLIGTSVIIGSGAVLNNYLDRDLDKRMKRTQSRALATGRIQPRNALIFGLGLLLLGLIVLFFLANPLAAVCGLVGHIFYVLIYTPMKRVSTLNTVVGSVSGAMPPLIGWAAVTGTLDLGAWTLFLIIFLWQSPHFLSLAMMKVEDYRAGGIPMLPVVRGFEETKRQMFFWGAALLPASLILFLYGNVGMLYFIVASIMGIIYVVLLFQGFSAKDDMAWAKKLFGYSLIYLTVMCAAMVISAILVHL
ncbi:protoheme IX farnesyltransferase [Brevibacillus sp. 7WMA2]|uniref:heme o synthase n=1 Tax=Brevibacillus TaxID=55080 RepID=UPI0003B2258F|nr:MULTISPECIES: heme o synthase [Brevibacillus]AUM66847.1 protoheme IX farnesyltransferase [Brevibacillus laterosporus]AYK05714.1 protoheme IX farnesyltransferase [Brevibacillus laterosporus]ERM17822.1 protoheme IX farnesyltransferase [Brevibacillus laterosporus PE36]MCR8964326.1 heme o synthase [Brevibacillus laterosporus]MCR8995873.1 heme o synthase [Brevibacillus laterosporus]